MQGAQATAETVQLFQLSLQSLVDEAKAKGVVLTVDLVPLQPLAMGQFLMAPLARPAWSNS